MSEKKILLVEDDSVCLHFMEVLLEERYILKLASNGEEALEIAEEFKPDLIMLNIKMPGINGFQVSESLRLKDPEGKIKVIFVSAVKPPLQKRIEIQESGHGFLLKPFEAGEFNYRIEKMLAENPP